MTSVVSEAVWLQLLERDEYKCLNCNNEEDLQPAHYIARSLLGSNDVENIMLLCAYCHTKQEQKRLLVRKINNKFFFKEI